MTTAVGRKEPGFTGSPARNLWRPPAVTKGHVPWPGMLRLSFYWVFNTFKSKWKCLSNLFCICLACFLIENKTKQNKTLSQKHEFPPQEETLISLDQNDLPVRFISTERIPSLRTRSFLSVWSRCFSFIPTFPPATQSQSAGAHTCSSPPTLTPSQALARLRLLPPALSRDHVNPFRMAHISLPAT